jgi:hypothetical protein
MQRLLDKTHRFPPWPTQRPSIPRRGTAARPPGRRCDINTREGNLVDVNVTVNHGTPVNPHEQKHTQLDLANEGLAWRENRISQGRVLKMHQFIENENPEIYEWFISKLNDAVERGMAGLMKIPGNKAAASR